MNIDRFVLAFAGSLILLSLMLDLVFSQWWFLLTGLVGLNMLQLAFTRLCPLAVALNKVRVKPGQAFN